MSNFGEKISVGMKMLLMTVTIVAGMSIIMSVKVNAAQACDITCTCTAINGTSSFTISNVTPGVNAYIEYDKMAELITAVTPYQYSKNDFSTVAIGDDILANNYPLSVDAANERVSVTRSFSAAESKPIINVRMSPEDFMAVIYVTCKDHGQPSSNPKAKPTYYINVDDDDSSHDEEGGNSVQNPVNPNALLAVSFAGADGILRNAKLGPQVQGDAAQLAFRLHTPAGWKEAFTFNMTVNDQADYTLKKGTLSFLIPAQYQKAGRTFALLGVDKDGNVKMFPDIDTKPDTITVNIDIEGYAFDLIYFD